MYHCVNRDDDSLVTATDIYQAVIYYIRRFNSFTGICKLIQDTNVQVSCIVAYIVIYMYTIKTKVTVFPIGDLPLWHMWFPDQ